MPSGSAMKAVAKLVDEGKVMKRCLLCSLFCIAVFLHPVIVLMNLLSISIVCLYGFPC